MSLEDKTLREARDWLRDRVDEGASCPCCGQLAKVYRRKITSSSARGLIVVWLQAGRAWTHLPTTAGLARLGGEFARLRYWGLVEEDDAKREDGGRAGNWRLTDPGVAFVRNQHRVPKYAYIYDGRLLDLVGEPVNVHDALGRRFRYDDLMAGV